MAQVPDTRTISDDGAETKTQPIETYSILSNPATTNAAPSDRFSWALALWVLWIAVTMTCLFQSVWQHVVLVRMLNRGTRIDDQQWLKALA